MYACMCLNIVAAYYVKNMFSICGSGLFCNMIQCFQYCHPDALVCQKVCGFNTDKASADNDCLVRNAFPAGENIFCKRDNGKVMARNRGHGLT